MSEQKYLELLREVLTNGNHVKNRTSIDTLSIIGSQIKYDLVNQFPLFTTKKIHWKSVVHELLWFIKGDTNIKYLNDNGVNIWNEWANDNGDLGPIYGHQWRKYMSPHTHKPIDQLQNIINEIKSNPDSRRLIVCSWNPADLQYMALPPCHCLFQFHVQNNELSCHLYQRSADLFLGVPFNVASYSLLTYMIAHECNLEPKAFIHTISDAHIYVNHIDQVKEQLSRKPNDILPKITLNPFIENIFDITFDDIYLSDYFPQSIIKAEVAI